MPQNQLLQTLLQRAGDEGQTQTLPNQLLPGQPQDSAPFSGLRKPFEGGMDMLLSALGIRGQKPGDLVTGLGAAAGAAMPMLPFGKMAGVLKGLGGAPAEAEQLSPILQQIFSENPKARVLYERAMASQAPDILAAKRAAQEAANQQRTVVNPARYARSADTHDALLDLTVDRPRPIPTDTGFATAIPTGRSSAQIKPATPELPSNDASGGIGKTIATKMGKSGLTEDMIREIRQIGPDAAAAKYPDMNPTTLYGIARGDVYGRIK